MKNVLEFLEKSALSVPTAIACGDEKEELSYSALLLASKKLGAFLSQHTAPRRPVALYLEKSVPALIGFFGIVYAGGFYSVLDPSQPMARTVKILETLEPSVVLTDYANRERAEEIIAELRGTANTTIPVELYVLNDLPGIKDRGEAQAEGVTKEEETLLSDIRDQAMDVDPLYVNFTSGSTGVPKGVTVGHRSVISFISSFVEIFGIDKEDVLGNQAPFDFDVSVKDIYSALFAGCRLQLIPRSYFSNPMELMDYLSEKKITNLTWAVSALCFVSVMNGLEYKVPEKVKRVMFSGEVMPIKHLNHWKKYLPEAMYVNLYGPTEITCNCCYYILDREFQEGEKIPLGKTFPNEKVFLLGEDGEEIRPGMIAAVEDGEHLKNEESPEGEILVSGAGLAIGYYKDTVKTEEAFTQNPLNKAYYERCYRTGDLARYNEKGELVYCSRKDFQIKRMGHRIELGEIESTAMKIEEVTRALALYEADEQKLWLFYTGKADRKEIAKTLRSLLPPFMIPNKTIQIEEMPLTKNGKIDRAALLARTKSL
ncbi:MAG: amino acid adenylation domain-containing protein [Lachnospiraceae bacterium]|nr:amino acid adenylation domain-containing protein [Lachnospiraceae bacterium]